MNNVRNILLGRGTELSIIKLCRSKKKKNETEEKKTETPCGEIAIMRCE